MLRLFASHNWGHGAHNHSKVKEVVIALRKLGYTVWFDETNMKGNIMDAMCNGIDNSDAILVFLTKEYLTKVASGNDADNVRREFMYAQRRHDAHRIIPIRFDSDLPRKWHGPVDMILGERLYADLSSETAFASKESIEALVRLLPEKPLPKHVFRRAVKASSALARRSSPARRSDSPVKRAASPAKRPSTPSKFKMYSVDKGTVQRASSLEEKAKDARSRVSRLMTQAGMSEHVGERTHEKLKRLMESIGVVYDTDEPFCVRLEKVEEQLSGS